LILQKDSRPAVSVLLGIVALGALLRLYHLAAQALWYDDITTLAIAAKSLRFILCQYPAYKPVYIIVLKAWTGIFGIGAVAAKMLPALSGIASIFLVFLIGKGICNRRVGLISAFLLSISCFHIYHSRQIKQYAFLSFLILLSIFFFIKFISERKTRFLAANALLNIAIIFVHPFGFSLVLVQIAHMLVHQRLIAKADLKRWFLAQAPLLCTCGVWCAVMLRVQSHLQAVLWWVPRPDTASLLETFATFCYGARYGLSDVTVAACPAFIAAAIIAIFGLLFIRGLFVVFKYYPRSHMKICVIWLFLPVALAFLFSRVFFPVYVVKHLLIALPAFYYIVAIGLWHNTKASFAATILLVIFVLHIVPLGILYGARAGADWQEAVQLMKKHSLKEDDIIVMATTKEAVCLIYYLSDADRQALREVGIFGKLTDKGWQDSFRYRAHEIMTLGSELPGKQEACYNPCYHIEADFDSKVLRESFLRTDKRVWLLISKWSGGEYDQEKIARKLQAYFKMTVQEEAAGVRVYRFEPGMAGT